MINPVNIFWGHGFLWIYYICEWFHLPFNWSVVNIFMLGELILACIIIIVLYWMIKEEIKG